MQIGDQAIAFYNQYMPGTKKNLELKSRPSLPRPIHPFPSYIRVGIYIYMHMHVCGCVCGYVYMCVRVCMCERACALNPKP